MTGGAADPFDLDGTLVDSDAKHMSAFQRVFARHGVFDVKASYGESIHGSSNELIGKVFLSHLPLERQRAILAEKEVTYRADLGDVEPIAGVVALLDFAEMRGLRLGAVTDAPRANAKAVLAAFGIEERLTTVVVGSELPRSKPGSLPYLRGLALTASVAARSVAFEDSVPRVRAAVAAGLAVVGLNNLLDEATLIRAGASLAVSDFMDPRIFTMTDDRVCAGARAG